MLATRETQVDATWFEVADGRKKQREVAGGDEYRARLLEVLGEDLGEKVDTLWRIVEPRAARRAADAAGEEGPAV